MVDAQSIESCDVDVTGSRKSGYLYGKQGYYKKVIYHDGILTVRKPSLMPFQFIKQ